MAAPQHATWWAKSTLLSYGWVHVHRVQARATGEGNSPVSPVAVPPPAACPIGEPCRRRWRPIKVGERFTRLRRTRWWGLGDCQGFLQLWPRWSAARRGGARRRAPSNGVGVQLRWATARPYLGGCPGEASKVAGWLQLAGHGGGARRSSGRGPVPVARALWPAIGVSIYAAILRASQCFSTAAS